MAFDHTKETYLNLAQATQLHIYIISHDRFNQAFSLLPFVRSKYSISSLPVFCWYLENMVRTCTPTWTNTAWCMRSSINIYLALCRLLAICVCYWCFKSFTVIDTHTHTHTPHVASTCMRVTLCHYECHHGLNFHHKI